MLRQALVALTVMIGGLLAVGGSWMLVGCRQSTTGPQDVPPLIVNAKEGVITFENNKAKIRVKLLTTAVDRITVPEIEKFDESGGVATGLLHSLPEGTHTFFRQRQTPVKTQLALLRADGEIVDIVSLYPAPIHTDYGAVLANGTTAYTSDDVRFCLQAPPDFFIKNAIGLGSKAVIPKDFFEPKPQPVLPMIEFLYVPDGVERIQANDRKARYGLNVALTPADRDRWLSDSALAQLSDSEALLVAWPTERRLRIDTRYLSRSIFIVPWSKDRSPSYISDKLIELRPLKHVPGEPTYGKESWEKDDLRNWEWASQEKYNGFLLFAGPAIYKLKLPRDKSMFGGIDFDGTGQDDSGGRSPSMARSFSVSLPEEVLRLPLIDDPATASVRLKADGQNNPVTIQVKPLTTNDERYAGLLNAEPLGEAVRGGMQVPPQTQGFDPTLNPPAAKPEGYLMCFDRPRRRPLFTGGLRAPFDVGLFNEADRLVQVVSVAKAEELAPQWPKFTDHEHRYVLLMPHKWFAHHGFVGQTGHVLPTNALEVPGTWARIRPEPERYELKINGKPAWVEVAHTKEEISRGLMWRRYLDLNCGMIFLFAEPKEHHFWMQNCWVDLNAAYIRRDWTIAKIVDMLHPLLPDADPKSEENKGRPKDFDQVAEFSSRRHGSGEAVPYVLEMELGWFKRWGLTDGAKIEPGPVIAEYARLATTK